MEITYSYYLFIIFPIMFYLSSISYKKSKIIFIINIIICGILLLFGLIFIFIILAQSTTFEYLFFNPYFILFVISVIIIIKFSFMSSNEKIKEENDEWEEMIEK